MRGGRTQQIIDTSNKTEAVERAVAEHAEACECRCAKRMNGGKAENTLWPGQKLGEVKE